MENLQTNTLNLQKSIRPNVWMSKSDNAREVKKLVFIALAIRLALCIFILLIGDRIDNIYIMTDDQGYELLGKRYMLFANSPYDLRALNRIGASAYMQTFWPYTVCVVSYIFKSIYASRFLNVVLSALAVKLIYDLTFSISENHTTSMKAAKIYAYFPYPVIICCFPIKDIYLTVAMLYAFDSLVRMHNNQKLGAWRVIACVILLWGAYWARGGVVELFMIFVAVFILARFLTEKNYMGFIFSAVLTTVLVYLLGDVIAEAFDTKITDYGDVDGTTTISAIQMTGWSDFYKLPLTYLFAMLQPVKLQLFNFVSDDIWYQILCYGNLTMVPIACGAFLYIFQKKHHMLFWMCSTAMYCAVATLTLGVYRHYLFLLPLAIINYALYKEDETQEKKNIHILMTVSLYAAILVYGAYQFASAT